MHILWAANNRWSKFSIAYLCFFPTYVRETIHSVSTTHVHLLSHFIWPNFFTIFSVMWELKLRPIWIKTVTPLNCGGSNLLALSIYSSWFYIVLMHFRTVLSLFLSTAQQHKYALNSVLNILHILPHSSCIKHIFISLIFMVCMWLHNINMWLVTVQVREQLFQEHLEFPFTVRMLLIWPRI